MRFFRSPDIHIELANNEHLTEIAAIHAICFDPYWSEDDLAKLITGVGVSCLIARYRGDKNPKPLGFVLTRTVAGQSEILSIAIAPKMRKRGIAKALMEHVIRQLQVDRVGELFLEVSEANMAARKLYASLNFKKISERKSYYRAKTTPNAGKSAPHANAFVMQLELR